MAIKLSLLLRFITHAKGLQSVKKCVERLCQSVIRYLRGSDKKRGRIEDANLPTAEIEEARESSARLIFMLPSI